MTKIDLNELGSITGAFKLLLVLLFIITNICYCQQESNDEIISGSSSITLQFTAPDSKPSNDTRTDVSVTKTIAGNGNKLKIEYDVDVPSVDDFYFVLALDSSGSLGFAGDSEQAKAVINAVPRFINHTMEKYPNKTFNLSIVSWDNDIDFTYPDQTKLSPIRTVSAGLNNVFGEVDDPKYLYRCSESEGTDLSQPIRASIDILNNNPPADYRRNMKFILLVVGAGEYAKCDPEILAEARNNNYNIYIVGMGKFQTERGKFVKEGSPTELHRELVYVSGENDRVSTCMAQGPDLSIELFDKLNMALSTAITENVADNVTIIETFYGYIEPDETVSWELVGIPETKRYINFADKIDGSDNTKTMVFQLPELVQDNTTKIILGANFSLKALPISFSKDSKPIIFGSSAENAPIPTFNYRWLKNDSLNFSIELRESIISIESSPAAVDQRNQVPLRPSNPHGEEFLGIGFGFMTIMILGITAIILRKKI
jgi:hypothetical protein